MKLNTTLAYGLVVLLPLLCCGAAEPAPAEESYETRMARARELRLAGHTAEALAIYDDVLARNDADVDALVQRGFCLIREADRLEEALSDFNRVIEKSPAYLDAYVGAAIVHRRLGDRQAAESVLAGAEMRNRDDPDKMRYLATTCWREGYYKTARRLDREFEPAPDRVLQDNPRALWLSYSFYRVTDQADWQAIGASYTHKPRPDITLSAGARNWWRYDMSDAEFSLGASYRHSKALSLSYDFDFSDNPGFLALRKHDVEAAFGILPGTSLEAGAGLSNYGDGWSRRAKLGLTHYLGNWWMHYHITGGRNWSGQSTTSHSTSIGYYRDLRYSVSAGYSQGDEVVDFERAGEIMFRVDRVDAATLSLRYYLNPQTGINLIGLYEWRNSEQFRRGATLSIFRLF